MNLHDTLDQLTTMAPNFADAIRSNLDGKITDRDVGYSFELRIAGEILSRGFTVRDPVASEGTFDFVLRHPDGSDIAAVEATVASPLLTSSINASASCRRSVETILCNLETAARNLSLSWTGPGVPWRVSTLADELGVSVPAPDSWVAEASQPDPYPQSPVAAVGVSDLESRLRTETVWGEPRSVGGLVPVEVTLRAFEGAAHRAWHVRWWSPGFHNGTMTPAERHELIHLIRSGSIGRVGCLYVPTEADVEVLRRAVRKKAKQDQWRCVRLPRVLIAGLHSYDLTRDQDWTRAVTTRDGEWGGGRADTVVIVPSALVGPLQPVVVARTYGNSRLAVAVGRALGGL